MKEKKMEIAIKGEWFYLNGRPTIYFPYCDEDLRDYLINLEKKYNKKSTDSLDKE